MKGPINMMIEMSKLDEFISWMQEYDTPSVEAVISILIENLVVDRGCDICDVMNDIATVLYAKIKDRASRKKRLKFFQKSIDIYVGMCYTNHSEGKLSEELTQGLDTELRFLR